MGYEEGEDEVDGVSVCGIKGLWFEAVMYSDTQSTNPITTPVFLLLELDHESWVDR